MWYNALELIFWIVRGGNLIGCLFVGLCQYEAVFEVHGKELISNEGFLNLSFDIGWNTLQIWYECGNLCWGFRSTEGSVCGRIAENEEAVGTISIIVFEQAVCWTPNRLRGSVPTVLTRYSGWNWVKLSGKFIFSVFFNSWPLCNGKGVMRDVWKLFAFFQDFSENWLKFVIVLLSSNGCFFCCRPKSRLLGFFIVIFGKTGIHQAGIMCFLLFGTTHAH